VGVSGKQFSQNYRWSGKYVEWRSGALTSRNTPTVTITTPTSTAQWSTSVSSISLAGTASSLQGVTLVTWTSDHGGSGVATGTSTWSANDIALQIGSNQITVTAVDTAGSAASVVLTVTYSSPDTAVPNADLVLPSDGRGTAQTFTFVFSDSQSATNLAAAAMLFAPVLDGQNSCFVIYFQNQGTIQLEWDDVTGNEIKPAGSSGTLQNSQCAIGATSVSATALSTTITLDITFKSAFTGLKNIYMYGADGDGSINTGWVKMGTYEVADSPASDTAIRFQ
jgi:hypothetical protein